MLPVTDWMWSASPRCRSAALPSYGSGAGGGVVAKELAESGREVAILEEAGTSFEQVIKRTVHISDAKFYEKMLPVLEEYFVTPVASTTLRGGLMREDMLLEVEVIAVLPGWEETH